MKKLGFDVVKSLLPPRDEDLLKMLAHTNKQVSRERRKKLIAENGKDEQTGTPDSDDGQSTCRFGTAPTVATASRLDATSKYSKIFKGKTR